MAETVQRFSARGIRSGGPPRGFADFLMSLLPALQVEQAMRQASEAGTTLPDAIAALGFMTEAQACASFATWMGRPFVDLASHPPSATAARCCPSASRAPTRSWPSRTTTAR